MEYTVVQLVKSNHADYQAEIMPRLNLLPERYEEYRAAYGALTKFMNGHLLAIVVRDLYAHRELLENMRAAVAENPWTLAEHNVELNQEALKNVLNFSAAVHAYQEHSEIRAGRNNSPEAKKYVKQVFRDAYDECDELFLFVRLRDVLVHNTQDILGISTGQSLNKKTNEAETHAEAFMFRDVLVKQDRLNARLKKFVHSWGPYLPVIDLMDQAVTDLEDIESVIMPHCYPDLYRHAQRVVRFRNAIQEELGFLKGAAVARHDGSGPPRNLDPLEGGQVTEFAERFMAAVESEGND